MLLRLFKLSAGTVIFIYKLFILMCIPIFICFFIYPRVSLLYKYVGNALFMMIVSLGYNVDFLHILLKLSDEFYVYVSLSLYFHHILLKLMAEHILLPM